ncbi:MAG: DUF1850 domain-containing protein [Treponematales bacterium]
MGNRKGREAEPESPARRGDFTRRRFKAVKRSLLFPLPLALALFVCTACAAQKTLVISDGENGKVFGRWALGEGGRFAVEFTHSVNNSPVRETFEARDGEIAAVSVRFSGFGAGMQSAVEGRETLARDGDALVIAGFDKRFRELRYIVGTVSDHLLFVGNGGAAADSTSGISLRELCGRNAHIVIRMDAGCRLRRPPGTAEGGLRWFHHACA